MEKTVTKTIALVAHDNCKKDLIEWAEWNWELLLQHRLICTGTTGRLLEEVLLKKIDDGTSLEFPIVRLKSGPYGGDQQLGAMIADGKIDLFIFFWDPMQPHPHDVDVKAFAQNIRIIQHSFGMQSGNSGLYYFIAADENRIHSQSRRFFTVSRQNCRNVNRIG